MGSREKIVVIHADEGRRKKERWGRGELVDTCGLCWYGEYRWRGLMESIGERACVFLLVQ